MPEYDYRGRSQGKLVNGVIEANSPEAVAKQLFARGITPLDIKQHKRKDSGSTANAEIHLVPPKVTSVDLIMFARQMYSLSRAGVPIVRAIRGLIETSRNPAMVEALGEVVNDLESGRPLSQCLARHPKSFPTVFISIVQVGENSGRLEAAFDQLATYLERERETKDQIKQAVRYPIFVIIALLAALVVINMVVIPAFAGVFKGLGADLPLATQILMRTSEFMLNYWWLMLAAAAAGLMGFRNWTRSASGGITWDRAKLHMPVVGGIIRKSLMSRFARSFAMALQSGVPLVQGLSLVGHAVQNRYLESRVNEIISGVQRGDSLLRTFTASNLFTPLVLQMVSVGEETGAIDTLMVEAADFYEREVDYELKNISSAIEPILVVAIGIMVLVLALGVFLPMWELSAAAR